MTRFLSIFAGANRRSCWRALVAVCALTVLSACSKSNDGNASPAASAVAPQAPATQPATASAPAAHDDAHAAMPAHGSAGAAPTNSPGKENGQSGHAPCAGDHSLVNGGGPTGVMGVMAASGQPPTANPAGDLPPAIGAPHLYHVGAEGFFLDQGSAVGLSPDQEAKLSAIKEKAGVAYAASQRKGAEAENDLWLLTSAEKPEITKIDAKISEIGRLVAQQRTDYIRAVGSAVAVLSDDQRKVIVASNPAAMPAAVASSPMKPDAPMPPGGQMGGSKMGGSKMGGSKMGGMEHGSIPMKPAMAPPGGMAAGGSPPGMAPGMGHM